MHRAFLTFDIGAILIALVAAFIPLPATWVEANYTNQLYLDWDAILRPGIDAAPFSVADVLLGFVLLCLVVWLVSVALRRDWSVGNRALLMFSRTLAVVALAFVWFKLGWGFNYQRVPVARKVPVTAAAVHTATVEAFGNRVVRMLNANVGPARAEHLTDAQIKAAIGEVEERVFVLLGDRAAVGMPLVKPTLFDAMLRATGDAGFMDPWTHEVNLYSGLFRYERPANFAHEWAHVAGFADEAEANYVAVLSCINSKSALARYSGWMLVWFNLPEDLRVTQPIDPRVKADAAAIVARYRKQVNQSVARAQQVAYDRYLKANRVEAGIDSYRQFVRWMVGARYDPDGMPIVRLPG